MTYVTVPAEEIDWKGIKASHYFIRFNDEPISTPAEDDIVIKHFGKYRQRKGYTTFNRTKGIATETLKNEHEFAIIYRVNKNGRTFRIWDSRW